MSTNIRGPKPRTLFELLEALEGLAESNNCAATEAVVNELEGQVIQLQRCIEAFEDAENWKVFDALEIIGKVPHAR